MITAAIETAEQRDPYLIYLDNTYLMDLADAGRDRHLEARRLLELFKRHATSELLQVRTSQWALAEAHSVLYSEFAKAAGHSDPSPKVTKPDPRYFLPAHVASVTSAVTALSGVIDELRDYTNFDLLPTTDKTHSGFWGLVHRVLVMGVVFAPDSIHLANAIEEGCSLIVTDDNDLLRKVDYLTASVINPYWAQHFADSPGTPPLTACGVNEWMNTYPSDGRRQSAIQTLIQRGFT